MRDAGVQRARPVLHLEENTSERQTLPPPPPGQRMWRGPGVRLHESAQEAEGSQEKEGWHPAIYPREALRLAHCPRPRPHPPPPGPGPRCHPPDAVLSADHKRASCHLQKPERKPRRPGEDIKWYSSQSCWTAYYVPYPSTPHLVEGCQPP